MLSFEDDQNWIRIEFSKFVNVWKIISNLNWEFWRRFFSLTPARKKFNSRTFKNNANLAAARTDRRHEHEHTSIIYIYIAYIMYIDFC